MDKRYRPEAWEDKIYNSWEKKKAFIPKRLSKQKPFSIIMPPPNANAPLHIGHAMFVSLQDILVRYHRLLGDQCLWLPGADHAGILTQVVFEKHLAQKGKTRFDLGKKRFYQECMKFTQKNKKIMYDQFKRLGASCDWKRQRFTLDRNISSEVIRTFVKLYEDCLAYRGERLINWCPRCMTSLSDLEVKYKEVKTKLWYIKYPLKRHSSITGETRFLVVATTRPETMLGDTGLAVHPDDQRYQKFIGQKAILPLVGRELSVVSDALVDPEFGTGVVKITPAHDPQDWRIGAKHKLKPISVIDFDNKMTEAAGEEFGGLEAKEARKKIVEKLNKKNLLIKQRAYFHQVGHCERCQTVIEPLISKQWFLNVSKKSKLQQPNLKKMLGVKKTSLKQLGSLAVRKGLIQILPKRFKKNYLNWMENLEDWCVSRQIWWGHQLPIYYCGLSGLSPLQRSMNPELIKKIKRQKLNIKNSNKKSKIINGCGHVMVSLTRPTRCPKCKGKIIIQDPDTFDTWFSSGQWAHNSLGYPQSKDFQYWYPSSVMETGYEILNIWVAKMIMLSFYRTHNIPFKTVYLHGLVRDAFGQKMSKSKGNVIDPLDVVKEHGADALRMALVIGTSPGNDLSITEEKIKGYRNFTNKIWNIGRFINLGLKSADKQIPEYKDNLKDLTKEDKKIIKKLNELIKQTTEYLNELKFSPAGEAVYHFLWHEFADKYIEYSKSRLKQKDKAVLSVLHHVYLNCLKLLHPFMPFVTEAAWQQMPPKNKEPLILSSWPEIK